MRRPAGRNKGITMLLTPASYGWKNPDRSQKEKTFTSNPGVAQPFVAQSDDRLQPKKARGYENVTFWGTNTMQVINAVTRAISSSQRILTATFRFIAVLLLVLAGFATAKAQQTNATIVGNVTDTTGAVMAGAKVTATEGSTNTVRSTVTDNNGAYTIPALPVGIYSLSVENAGFESQKATGIKLDASQTARQDFKMSVGQVNQTVAVEAGAAAAQLQTETGAVGQVIDGRKIVELPLNGRNFVQLAQLIPGVNTGVEGSITVRRARGSIATTDATGGTISIQVNGERDTQNLFSIDGTEAMDYDAWTYSFSPSVDAIAEFRVDTSSSGTDSGAAAGANVNIIIKSGTNNLHGTLWEFNRNNDFTQTYDAVAKTDVPGRAFKSQPVRRELRRSALYSAYL